MSLRANTVSAQEILKATLLVAPPCSLTVALRTLKKALEANLFEPGIVSLFSYCSSFDGYIV